MAPTNMDGGPPNEFNLKPSLLINNEACKHKRNFASIIHISSHKSLTQGLILFRERLFLIFLLAQGLRQPVLHMHLFREICDDFVDFCSTETFPFKRLGIMLEDLAGLSWSPLHLAK